MLVFAALMIIAEGRKMKKGGVLKALNTHYLNIAGVHALLLLLYSMMLDEFRKRAQYLILWLKNIGSTLIYYQVST